MLSRVVRPIVAQQGGSAVRVMSVRNCSAMYHEVMARHEGQTLAQICKETNMHHDSLPIPTQKWSDYYGKKNTQWNLQMLGSILFAVASFSYFNYAGMMNLHDFKPSQWKNVEVDSTKMPYTIEEDEE